MSRFNQELATLQFKENLDVLLQRQGSELRMCVMTGGHDGEGASPVSQKGSVQSYTPGKFSEKKVSNPPTDRRWVHPTPRAVNILEDKLDQLQSSVQLDSQDMQLISMSLGRDHDDEIIRAFHGTNRVGKRGELTRAFKSENKIAAGTNPLTVKKLKQAAAVLQRNHVMPMHGPKYVLINSYQKYALLNDLEMINQDYVSKSTLEAGTLPNFLGFQFVEFEGLKSNGAETLDYVPIFVRAGLYLGLWEDITASISQRRDLDNDPWQYSATSFFGATRLQEDFCVEVACSRPDIMA